MTKRRKHTRARGQTQTRTHAHTHTHRPPTLSWIVSAYDDPSQLCTCLSSIAAQTFGDWEVVVTDNAVDPVIAQQQQGLVMGIGKVDPRFLYVLTAGKVKVSDCYWSSEYGMAMTTGQWLAFPCDDIYYPPEWARRMLTVAMRDGADLVLCANSVTGPRTCGIDGYAHLKLGTQLYPGYKPSFIVRRDKFDGWVNKPLVSGCSGVDRTTLQYLMQRGDVKTSVCAEVWYFHN